MRIRELLFVDVRGFRGKHRISFVDPITEQVRPVTIITGTNGTGKTTILDAIEEMLRFARRSNSWNSADRPLLNSILQSGLIVIEIALNDESNQPTAIKIAVGNYALAQQTLDPDTLKNCTCYLLNTTNGQPVWESKHPILNTLTQALDAKAAIAESKNLLQNLPGGMIYLPANRRISPMQSGTVQPPDETFEWVARVTPSNHWMGSLEHFWVGQNYLDLEATQNGEATGNLAKFVDLVEDALGKDRKISIKRGRVLVPTHWRNAHSNGAGMVQIDQLSSGEQQILFILGELARRRRDNGIIAIDEPELSLHPTLQRKLLWQLRQFALKTHSQLILATHSLEILNGVRASERLVLDQLTSETEEEREGDTHATQSK